MRILGPVSSPGNLLPVSKGGLPVPLAAVEAGESLEFGCGGLLLSPSALPVATYALFCCAVCSGVLAALASTSLFLASTAACASAFFVSAIALYASVSSTMASLRLTVSSYIFSAATLSSVGELFAISFISLNIGPVIAIYASLATTLSASIAAICSNAAGSFGSNAFIFSVAF